MPEVVMKTTVKASFDPINQYMYTVQAETLIDKKSMCLSTIQRIEF